MCAGATSMPAVSVGEDRPRSRVERPSARTSAIETLIGVEVDPDAGREVRLRVHVDEQDPEDLLRERAREVDRGRRLADATLLVGDRDHVRQGRHLGGSTGARREAGVGGIGANPTPRPNRAPRRVVHTMTELCTVLWISAARGPRFAPVATDRPITGRSRAGNLARATCARRRAAVDRVVAAPRMPVRGAAYDGAVPASLRKDTARNASQGEPGRVEERASGSPASSGCERRHSPGRGTGAGRAPARLGQADGARAPRPAARSPGRSSSSTRSSPTGRRSSASTASTSWATASSRDTAPSTGGWCSSSPGLHGLRRLAVRGVRREDLQDHGSRDEGRGARSSGSTTRAARGSRRASRRSAATRRSSCATSWRRASCRRSR